MFVKTICVDVPHSQICENSKCMLNTMVIITLSMLILKLLKISKNVVKEIF